MSAKPTPGKWRAECVGSGGPADNPVDVYEIVADGRVRVAEYLTEADARLIAEAKNLRAALRDMLDWLDDGNRILSDECRADVNAARAILARATGEQQ